MYNNPKVQTLEHGNGDDMNYQAKGNHYTFFYDFSYRGGVMDVHLVDTYRCASVEEGNRWSFFIPEGELGRSLYDVYRKVSAEGERYIDGGPAHLRGSARSNFRNFMLGCLGDLDEEVRKCGR